MAVQPGTLAGAGTVEQVAGLPPDEGADGVGLEALDPHAATRAAERIASTANWLRANGLAAR
jgi:hypothetical protein